MLLSDLITSAPFLTSEQKAQYLARIPSLTPEGVAKITAYLTEALAAYEQELARIDGAIVKEAQEIEARIEAHYKAAQREVEMLVHEGEEEDLEKVLTQL